MGFHELKRLELARPEVRHGDHGPLSIDQQRVIELAGKLAEAVVRFERSRTSGNEIEMVNLAHRLRRLMGQVTG